MGNAFEDACKRLGLADKDNPFRQNVADRVIALAQRGDDPAALFERVLRSFQDWESPAAKDQDNKDRTGEAGLAGRRVLLVEDEFLISDDISLAFARRGVSTIAAHTLEGAMDLLESLGKVDGAVLDINLQGEMVFPLADALRKRCVPFVFATGYNQSVIPERYQTVPRFEKPVDPAKVVHALFAVASRS